MRGRLEKETGVGQEVYFLSFSVYRETHAGGGGSWGDRVRCGVRNEKGNGMGQDPDPLNWRKKRRRRRKGREKGAWREESSKSGHFELESPPPPPRERVQPIKASSNFPLICLLPTLTISSFCPLFSAPFPAISYQDWSPDIGRILLCSLSPLCSHKIASHICV